MVDSSAQANARTGIYRNGVVVTIQRPVGFAPNVPYSSSATVTAFVRKITPDTTQTAGAGLSASAPGAIEQGDRQVLVMNEDLAAMSFALPVVKGDQIVLPFSNETLNITEVDAYSLNLAGVTQFTAVGVS